MLCHIAFHLAAALCSDRDSIATKAFRYLERILDALLEAMKAIETARVGMQTPWPMEVQEAYGGLLRGVDQIALRLTIDGGAHGHSLTDIDTLDPAKCFSRRDAIYLICLTHLLAQSPAFFGIGGASSHRAPPLWNCLHFFRP